MYAKSAKEKAEKTCGNLALRRRHVGIHIGIETLIHVLIKILVHVLTVVNRAALHVLVEILIVLILIHNVLPILDYVVNWFSLFTKPDGLPPGFSFKISSVDLTDYLEYLPSMNTTSASFLYASP